MIIQAKTSLKDRVFRFGLIFILPVSLGIYLGLITPWLWFISIPLIIIPIGLLVISKSKKASEIIKKMAFEISEK